MGYNNILQYLDSDIEILELGFLESAPWPMTKSELVDYAKDNGFPNNLVHAIKNVKDGVYIYDSGNFYSNLNFTNNIIILNLNL